MLYSSRLPAFHQDQLQTVAVSELPGYPGRWHAQRSHYITTKFPHKEISTIDQNFTWNRQWCPQTYVCTYHSFFSTTNCAPIPSWSLLILSPNYLRQPSASTAHCPLPDWEREAGGPELLSIIMSRMARIQWTQCVILGQLPNVIPSMRQLWLSRSVKKGCCYAEGEDMTSHRSNTIEYAPNTAKLTSNSMNKTTLHMAPRVSNITVRTALASL